MAESLDDMKDVIALLRPATNTAKRAIDEYSTHPGYVRFRTPPASPDCQSYSSQDSDPESITDAAAREGDLKISLEHIPNGPLGFLFGRHKNADFRLFNPRVSDLHFSLTFNDDYKFIVKDLESRKGTSVIYYDKEGNERNGSKEPRRGVEWIIGGEDRENLPSPHRTIIKVSEQLQFRIVVLEFDRNSEAVQDKIRKFRAGTGADRLDECLQNIDLQSRASTGQSSVAQTPSKEPLLVATRRLGQGTFGTVDRAWNASTGKICALKLPHGPTLGAAERKAWAREAELMEKAKHPYIVAFLSYNPTPLPSLRLEFIPSGSLKDLLNKHKKLHFSAHICVLITRQMTSALAYLHDKCDIAHRDISEGNILVAHHDADTIEVKLADLGCAKAGSPLNTLRGTPLFWAPELRKGLAPGSPAYTKAVDVWALGAVVAKLLSGPWLRDIRRHVEEYYTKSGEELARLLLEQMLVIAPEGRAKAQACCNRSSDLSGSKRTWREIKGWGGKDEADTEQTTEEDTGAETVRPYIYSRDNEPATQSNTTAGASTTISSSDSGAGVESLRSFERSDSPSRSLPATASVVLDRIVNPTDSLFYKSDLGGDSHFSEDTESSYRTVTSSRHAVRVGESARPSSIHNQSRSRNSTAAAAAAASHRREPIVPQKRPRETSS